MTRTKYGVSPWVDQFPSSKRLNLPRFSAAALQRPGSAAVPVVIVGGGLAGVCTAYALAASGVKAVLLEADRVGAGGASRSPGVLQGEASASYRVLEERNGRRAARAMFEASRRAVLELASTARRLGIKAHVETHDALRITPPFSTDGKAFGREVNLRRDVGLEAVALKAAVAGRESGIEHVSGGARFHDWGQLDPYRLLVGFARAAIDRGALIYERSPVRRIKVRRKDVEVHTAAGVITAETVAVCTGEPTDLFRSLKRHARFEERYAVLTERLPAAVRKQIGARARLVTDTESPAHLIRWTEDDRLLMSGGDQPRTADRGRDKVLLQRTGQLMYELLRLYPSISGLMPEYGWHIPTATTADGAMYAGPHRNYPRHLFVWATRHDPAQAFLASRILLRNVIGEPDKSDAYFAFTRG
jgi:glycine/D-amino acid oxidase-like deaminating enzyme